MKNVKKILFAVLACTVLYAPTSWAISLKAGFASRPMSIPQGISLASYPTRRRPINEKGNPFAYYYKPSTGQLDELRSKAVVLTFDTKTIVLVSLDLVAIDPQMRTKVGAALKDLGLTEENIFISATHTHSGPGCFAKFPFWEQFGSDRFNPDVLELFSKDIELSIREAYKKLAPAKLALGELSLPQTIINRRQSAAIDPVSTLIRVDNLDGRPMGTIINFGIHGTVLDETNFKLSADLPGSIERHFEALTGAPGFLFQSDEGDIAPNVKDRTYAALTELGSSIAQEMERHWRTMVTHNPKSFKMSSGTLMLGNSTLNVFGCFGLPPRKDHLSGKLLVPMIGSMPRKITQTAFAIDNHAFIFVPGEPIAELGLEIKRIGKAEGFSDVSMITLTNHYLGYMLSEKEYFRGGYESCVSFYGAKMGKHLIQGSGDLLKGLARK